MKESRFWWWFSLAATGIVGVLIILAWSVWAVIGAVRSMNDGIVDSVQEASDRALGPVGEMGSELGTQMAQVLHPTPTVLADPMTILREVRSLARLETIQYSLEKVITAETGQGALGTLFGDRLLFVAHGKVIAGVDMARLEPQDLWLQDGVLYVRMPEPEILVASLDNEKSYVYDRDTGLLTRGDVNLESTARRLAEIEIEKAALEDGILDLARNNAESYLAGLLRGLGYVDVIFVYEIEPTASPAATVPVTPAPTP